MTYSSRVQLDEIFTRFELSCSASKILGKRVEAPLELRIAGTTDCCMWVVVIHRRIHAPDAFDHTGTWVVHAGSRVKVDREAISPVLCWRVEARWRCLHARHHASFYHRDAPGAGVNRGHRLVIDRVRVHAAFDGDHAPGQYVRTGLVVEHSWSGVNSLGDFSNVWPRAPEEARLVARCITGCACIGGCGDCAANYCRNARAIFNGGFRVVVHCS